MKTRHVHLWKYQLCVNQPQVTWLVLKTRHVQLWKYQLCLRCLSQLLVTYVMCKSTSSDLTCLENKTRPVVKISALNTDWWKLWNVHSSQKYFLDWCIFFQKIGLGIKVIKHFFLRHWQFGNTDWSICLWKVFKASLIFARKAGVYPSGAPYSILLCEYTTGLTGKYLADLKNTSGPNALDNFSPS